MSFKCDIPAVPTQLQDDDIARITRWDFVPGAATGWHTHGWPYFVVLLTDAVVRIHDGEKVNDVPMSAGHSYMRPAGVTHDVMNGGDKPMAFIEIEVKRPDRLVMAK
jgi:mannose-6-phosphate isomerase-like protein (cupin superfamily)